MIRKLSIVAASAAFIAVISLSLAWVAGGADFQRKVMDDEVDWSYTIGGDDAGVSASKDFAFDAAKPFTVDIPAEVIFQRGDTPHMTVEGPANAVSDIRFENGRVFREGGLSISNSHITITVVSNSIPDLTLDSPADVTLDDLQQDSLRLNANGPASVSAKGKVRSLDLRTQGAADLDFGDVVTEDAVVKLTGVGDVTIAATGKADIAISGAGSVSLKRRPANLTTQISGIGSIDHDY